MGKHSKPQTLYWANDYDEPLRLVVGRIKDDFDYAEIADIETTNLTDIITHLEDEASNANQHDLVDGFGLLHKLMIEAGIEHEKIKAVFWELARRDGLTD